MKTLTLFLSTLIVIFFIPSCDQNDNEPEGIDHFLINFAGYVQKGPFIAGSSITISELTSDLQPTGRVFLTKIDNNIGKFELPNVELESRYVQLKADGFYFNERTGELSEAQLTLNSLVDITDLESFNINVLSHLEKDRIVNLMGTGMEFMEAKRTAMNEILGIFNLVSSEQLHSEQLDIASSGDDNAILLAVSIILQGDRSTSEFSDLMSQLSLDIREDGILNSESIESDLINGVNYANLQKIRLFIEERYDGFGIEYEIPDFEKYVNQFIDNTEFEFTGFIIYPTTGIHGPNILDKAKTDYLAGTYSMAVILPEGTSARVKIVGTNWVYSVSQDWSSWSKSMWNDEENSRTFTSIKTGELDFAIRLEKVNNQDSTISCKTNIIVFENEDIEPTWTKEITVN